MKFKIEKLGKINNADIELKDLTIICGPNGSNKTWLAYSIFHNLHFKHGDAPSLYYAGFYKEGIVQGEFPNYFIDSNSVEFKDVCMLFFNAYINGSNKNLSQTFNTHDDVFLNTKISCSNDSELVQLFIDSFKNTTQEFNTENHSISSTLNIKENNPIIEIKVSTGDDNTEQRTDLYEVIDSLISELICHLLSTISPVLRPFVISSERVGCLVFQKDIDGKIVGLSNKLDTLLERYHDNVDVKQALIEMHMSTLGHRAELSVPVRKNLDAVRNASVELKKVSFIKKQCPYVSDAMKEISQGSFSVENSVLTYKAVDGGFELPITVASSSIKSLFLIDLYVNSLARENDLLIIDEPELNLHPNNQRLMAKVIARLINSGVKVLITTHSDYLIREINNSIMLSNCIENKEEIMDEHNLIGEDILFPSQVSAYTVDAEGCVSAMEVNRNGINSKVFDSIINEANKLQGEIYFNLDDVDE
ncbi:AAA family ATPase [Pseudoalteromonas sp. SR45-6]|uniref:AAA family ATPase n=1 Tax=Pseudoalteromonas sp. SR45-6 TaxID=2760927 RepID=UPI001600B5E0|nr:AAA family ATPase [Pseudoalteromonas sp. SR45-6]MBB1341426.1 AAA family ATPase [Pseudoalteromonas sp. SR45-6]